MPIPLIIGGGALVAAAFGAKKGFDAKRNYSSAKNVVDDAMCDFGKTTERLDIKKNETTDMLKRLGVLRLRAEAKLLSRFVKIVKQVHHVNNKPIEIGGMQITISTPELCAMELTATKATELLKDGGLALSSGVLTAIGAGNLATSIGAASTGTLISSLSGAAATNATLAWLGGGSLASGGWGIIGGTAVLGGAIAGPTIAVMGFAAAKRSERALTKAFAQVSEIKEATEQVENGIAVLESIIDRTQELEQVIQNLSWRFEALLTEAEGMIHRKLAERKSQYLRDNMPAPAIDEKLDFNAFSKREQQRYMILTSFAYSFNALLRVELIDQDGTVSNTSTDAVAQGNMLLRAA